MSLPIIGTISLGYLVGAALVLLAILVPRLLKPAAIAAAAVFLVTSIYGLGVGQEHEVCKAKEIQAELDAANETIATLNQRLADLAEAARQDAARALAAEAAHSKAKEKADALARQVSDGDCFTVDDSHRLRELWGIAPPKR